MSFASALAPVALAGLVLTTLLIAAIYRGEFVTAERLPSVQSHLRIHRALVIRALLATAVMILLFVLGQPPAKAAIVVGGLLLLTRRLKSERIYAEIDWSLLLMLPGCLLSWPERSMSF